MDLIYKIYSVYLYDSELNHVYVFLHNRRKSFTGDVYNELPYRHTEAFREIYDLIHNKRDKEYGSKSIEILSSASKLEGIPFILAKDFITISKIRGTHLPNYNAYDIMWNEKESGINIFDYELASTWRPGSSSYSTYRIYEEKHNRDLVTRGNKFKKACG